MAEAMLASVVVRTQGRRLKLLLAALESLARQTYPALEVIVVEDGSAAAAGVVAAAEALRPNVFRHLPAPRQGRCRAGNLGLERARGALLGFLDEDDAVEPDHVATIAAALHADPAANCAYARATPLYCTGLDEDEPHVAWAGAPEGDAPFSRTLLWLRNSIPIQAALFRRELYQRCGGLDPDLDALEDWDLWLRYSAEKPFTALEAITSSYKLPASRSKRLQRARAHEPARAVLAAKHAALTGEHSFAAISALPAYVRGQASFRQAMQMAGAALIAKVRNGTRQ